MPAARVSQGIPGGNPETDSSASMRAQRIAEIYPAIKILTLPLPGGGI
jgi:hypothetical protein